MLGGRYGCLECVIVDVEGSSDVDEIVVPRGGGWDANQLAGRFGDAARTGDGWTASPPRSLIRAQNSDWGWCGDATAMPENLPVARPLNREKLIREAYSGEWSVCHFSLAVTSPPSPLSPATGDASLPPVPLRGRELIVEHGSTTHSIMCVVAIA